MKKGLSLLLFLGYCTLIQGIFLKPVTAQVTPDGTTNTTVDVSGNNFTIQEADIILSNAADVDVRGTGGGSIIINARNLNLEAGDFGRSQTRAGITADSTFSEAQAGNITINATYTISVSQGSAIANQVLDTGVGNTGGIDITTTNLSLTEGGFISASTFGEGNAALVKIKASDNISAGRDNSGIFIRIVSIILGGFSILGITSLALVMNRLNQTKKELESRVRERTADLADSNEDLKQRNILIRQVFGRYLSDEIVTNLLKRPKFLNLGGERRKITILTSDLRGFTAIAERLSAEEVIAILNSYLEKMADIIIQHQGTIIEFMGDGILVLFGAPTVRDDDSLRAIACAVEMQLAMETVNQRLKKLDFPQLEMGIGINTGLVVLGNIGSEKRAKYGVVGSHVNLTYRIESYTTGGQVLISESTLRESGPVVSVRGQKQVQPKGLKEPITIYELGGIGGTYNLFLKSEDEFFVNLTEAICIQYNILEGKHLGKNIFRGSLIKLSKIGAKVQIDSLIDYAVPAIFTNLKINLCTQNDSSEMTDQTKINYLSEDIYAKVTETSSEQGTFYIRFTAKISALQKKIDRLFMSEQ